MVHGSSHFFPIHWEVRVCQKIRPNRLVKEDDRVLLVGFAAQGGLVRWPCTIQPVASLAPARTGSCWLECHQDQGTPKPALEAAQTQLRRDLGRGFQQEENIKPAYTKSLSKHGMAVSNKKGSIPQKFVQPLGWFFWFPLAVVFPQKKKTSASSIRGVRRAPMAWFGGAAGSCSPKPFGCRLLPIGVRYLVSKHY